MGETKNKTCDAWDTIKAYVSHIEANNPFGKANYLVARFERFQAFRNKSDENQEQLDKAFKAISKYARTEDSILSLFLCLPDKADTQAYPAIYGKRTKTLDAEKDFYANINKLAVKLKKLINKQSIENIIVDLPDESVEYPSELRSLYDLPYLLNMLIDASDKARPSNKYLTSKPKHKNAAIQTYIAQLALLSDARNLTKPQHSAIATLAKANCPHLQVNRKAIADAYAKMPHDPRGKGLLKRIESGG